jgi:hypothetical protein
MKTQKSGVLLGSLFKVSTQLLQKYYSAKTRLPGTQPSCLMRRQPMTGWHVVISVIFSVIPE